VAPVGQQEFDRGWTVDEWAGGRDGVDDEGVGEEACLERVRRFTSTLSSLGNSIEVGAQAGEPLWCPEPREERRAT
jgi:hypothetical protein